MMQNSSPRAQYSAHEAARRLGVTIEQLRALVRDHIVREEDVPEEAVFHPQDLVLLRILAGKVGNAHDD
jgi:hypothetical protein